jgi:hypothetical protein
MPESKKYINGSQTGVVTVSLRIEPQASTNSAMIAALSH